MKTLKQILNEGIFDIEDNLKNADKNIGRAYFNSKLDEYKEMFHERGVYVNMTYNYDKHELIFDDSLLNYCDTLSVFADVLGEIVRVNPTLKVILNDVPLSSGTTRSDIKELFDMVSEIKRIIFYQTKYTPVDLTFINGNIDEFIISFDDRLDTNLICKKPKIFDKFELWYSGKGVTLSNFEKICDSLKNIKCNDLTINSQLICPVMDDADIVEYIESRRDLNDVFDNLLKRFKHVFIRIFPRKYSAYLHYDRYHKCEIKKITGGLYKLV